MEALLFGRNTLNALLRVVEGHKRERDHVTIRLLPMGEMIVKEILRKHEIVEWILALVSLFTEAALQRCS